ncbi:MAG: sulfatase-like hydrolase/transferase [Gemmataceae bacterium]
MRVVVIALKGCPVAALGPYGNEWVATPTLDRLAAEGVVFDRHLCDCPDPAAACSAWRTGSSRLAASNPATRPDLLDRLHAAGAATTLVRHNRPENDSPADFYAGWGRLFDARPDPADRSPADSLLRVLPEVLGALPERALVWVEIDRLLPPWDVPQAVFDAYVEELLDEESGESVAPWTDPPAGWFDKDDHASWELLHRSFAAAVTAFDADLERVFELVRGIDATAVLTADQGFPLGEHGIVGRFRPWLHEELVHVPLIVRLPGGAEAGRRVNAFTQPADLMPTLAGWFGVTVEPADGMSLLPLLRGEAVPWRDAAISCLTLAGRSEWAIRTDEWALLVPGEQPAEDEPRREPMLFRKPDDRWEVNDLRPRHLDTADELEARFRAATGAPTATG